MTRAAERQSDPSYTITQLWSEFGDYVTFFQQPVQQVNKLPEDNAVVRFP
jgi:hypothetical protein